MVTDARQLGEAAARARIARAAGQPAADADVDGALAALSLVNRALALAVADANESRALADRSAEAAVDAARELGAVASQAREALRMLLTATVQRDAAEAAHTNTASGGTLRHAAMAALLPARQRYADAVDAAARELGVDVGALRAARDGGR